MYTETNISNNKFRDIWPNMFRTPKFVGSFHPLSIDDCQEKKIGVKYFFDNYISAKFYQNRWFTRWYVLSQVY